jgi:hypothetical protein
MTVLPSIVAAPCGQLTLATIVLLAGTTATASSAPTAAAAAAAPAKLLSPADGATIYCARSGATPRFTWDAGPVPSAVAALPDTVIEIITSNVITYCSKVVVYPSGGVLNASSNAGGGEFDLEDNELHAVDSPRLCAKTDDDGGAVPVVPVGTRGHTVPAVVPTVPYGTCAFTENVSCEKLAQIVGHLSSSYIHRLLLATAVHDCRYLRISSISLPWCHLKCAALI